VLLELNLAHETKGDQYSNFRIEPVTGALYLLFLASRMAHQRELISDNSIYQSLLYTRLPATSINRHANSQLRLATAVFRAVAPIDFERVDLDVLLRIREDLAAERQRFQDKIAGLAKELQAPADEWELQESIERCTRAIQDEFGILEDKLRSSNVSLAQGLLSVSVPSYIKTSWLGYHPQPAFIAGAAVFALSAIAIKYLLERKQVSRASPYTYLLKVERRMNRNN
jgi:hypothetical protein